MAIKKTFLIFTLLFCQVFLSFFGWAALLGKIKLNKIITNTSIAGIPVQGLTCEQAKRTLEKNYPHPFEQTMLITAGEKALAVNLKEIGVEYRYLEALASSFHRQREKSGLQGLHRVLQELIDGPEIDLPIAVDEERLAEKLAELNRLSGKKPVNAALNWQDGRAVITPEEDGRAIDIQATLAKFRALGAPLPDQFEAVEAVVRPAMRAKELAEFKYVLGTFATSYATTEPARAHNIQRAAAAVDSVILRPGQIFSFNEKVGARTKENGYQKAPVIKEKRLEIGYGGGICQVSTTLYNAALLAGLEIIERHRHAMPIPYVKSGMDATVADNFLDFKFKNNLPSPVYLSCRAQNGQLVAGILGKTPPAEK